MDEPLEIDRCPTLAVLLQAQDDELSSSDAAAIRAHVRRCARCRERQHTFGECASVAGDSSPSAARARESAFLLKLREQSRKQSRIHVRLARWTRARVVPIAAVTLIFFVLTVAYWPSATLEAEELLDRAALSEQSRPAGWAQMVLLRVTATDAPRASMTHARLATFVVEAEIGDGPTSDRAGRVRTTCDTDAQLAALFARHHLDLCQPLSIAHIRKWRASVPRKRETVTPLDADTTRLHITADEGDLTEVEVVVHNVSLGVLRQTLVFRDAGKVEITTQGPPQIRLKPVTQSASDYKAGATPITTPLVPLAMPDLRPVEPPPLFGGAAIPQAALSRWLETTFGRDEQMRARFVRDLVERVSKVKRDLYTLQHLARRMPGSTPAPGAGASEASSASGEAAASAAVAADHAEAVRVETQRHVARQARALTAHLDQLATSMAMFGTTSRALPRTQVPANWRLRTTEALAQLDRFESQLADLLEHEDVAATRDEQGGLLPHPVSETFGALWNAWHAPREP